MSSDITSTYQAYYDPIVKQEYQGVMALKGAVRIKTGFEGNTVDFRAFGKGVAQPRGPLASDVPVMGNTYQKSTATMADYTAFDYTDIFSQAKVNFNEVTLQAESSAMAVGRMCDQFIINAMDRATVPSGNDIANGSTNFTFAKVQAAAKRLKKLNVPKDERYFLIDAEAEAALLSETKATSGDYVVNKPLQNGTLDGETWYGFKWIVIGDRDEGGLPVSGNIHTGFAFHGGARGCLGLGMGMDFKSSIDWIADKQSWLVGSKFSAGAVAIKDSEDGVQGLVKVDYDVTA